MPRGTLAMVETEIKLRWDADAASARAHIEACGFAANGPRLLEEDQLFDRASGELRQGRELLRLRVSAGVATVTYKGPPVPGPYKSREEIEFCVDNAEAFEIVLSRLGYQRVFRYEKYRTKFATAAVGLITLDETPIGIFIELEGPEYWIDAVSERLGFARSQFLTASYAALYAEFRVNHSDAPPNMVFSAPSS